MGQLGAVLISDSGWVTLGQVASALGALLGVKVLTELLSPHEFGVLALSIGAVTLAQGLFCTPIIHALLRFFPDFKGQGTTSILLVAAKSMILRRAGLLFIVGLASGLATHSLFRISVGVTVLLNAFLVCEMWRSFELNVFNAARQQKEYAILNGVDAWLKPIFALAIASLAGATVEAVLGGLVLGSFAMALGARLMQKNEPAPDGDGRAVPDTEQKIRQFASPLVPLAMVGWSTGMVDRYLIGAILGASAAGTYSAAYGLVSRPFLMMGQIVEQTLRQLYYEAATRRDEQLVRTTFRTWLISVALAGIVGFLAVLWASDWIVRFLLGPEYKGAAAVMPWIAGAYCLLATTQAAERRFYALYQTKRVLIVEGLGLLVMICVLPLLLPLLGIRGAAVALVAAAATQLGSMLYFMNRSTDAIPPKSL